MHRLIYIYIYVSQSFYIKITISLLVPGYEYESMFNKAKTVLESLPRLCVVGLIPGSEHCQPLAG